MFDSGAYNYEKLSLIISNVLDFIDPEIYKVIICIYE